MKKELDLSQTPDLGKTSFYKSVDVKRVLICFHGFETSTRHDISSFKEYFDKLNNNKNYEVALINLYDWGNKKTYKSKLMLQRAENAVKEYLDKGYVVYLLAYSFSVGIAAKCCTDFPQIEKLALISPTIYLIKTKLLSGYMKMLTKRLKFKAKYRKKAQSMIKRDHSAGLLKLVLSISKCILKYRKYLKALRCKVFMTKGNQDELCISNTFSYISHKSKNSITMSKIYPGEDHMMFMSLEHGKRAYDDVLRFIFHVYDFDEENENNDIRF